MSAPRLLPVHECFHTWQGEGCHLGRSAYFIRLFGCPVNCAWCDAAGTWHPDYVPADIEKQSPTALTKKAVESAAEIVVITGGEPAIHDLGPLTQALIEAGLPVHLETSGGFALRGNFDWVTVSPKAAAPPLPDVLARANELKVIVEAPGSIETWLHRVGAHLKPECVVWLHPEWGQRETPAVLAAISTAVKQGVTLAERAQPLRPRAGWQVHKLYRVDALDPASRAPAPLGGDPERGY
ncbi:MAG: 7-carboxy-7-deazaguanine synthase QueE [Opitutales bacterium]